MRRQTHTPAPSFGFLSSHVDNCTSQGLSRDLNHLTPPSTRRVRALSRSLSQPFPIAGRASTHKAPKAAPHHGQHQALVVVRVLPDEIDAAGRRHCQLRLGSELLQEGPAGLGQQLLNLGRSPCSHDARLQRGAPPRGMLGAEPRGEDSHSYPTRCPAPATLAPPIPPAERV